MFLAYLQKLLKYETYNIKNVDELEKYLTYNHFDETKFFVTPDCIKSIFGITDNGKGSPIEGYNYLFECEGLDEFLDKYESVIIGMDRHDNLLIDDDLCDEDKDAIDKFIESHKEIDVLYV